MKHLAIVLTLCVFGLAGCVTVQPAPSVTSGMKAGATAPAPVRPEQVTPQTAQKMSQALANELDREAQQEITATALPTKR
jgi:hypothetical protein